MYSQYFWLWAWSSKNKNNYGIGENSEINSHSQKCENKRIKFDFETKKGLNLMKNEMWI